MVTVKIDINAGVFTGTQFTSSCPDLVAITAPTVLKPYFVAMSTRSRDPELRNQIWIVYGNHARTVWFGSCPDEALGLCSVKNADFFRSVHLSVKHKLADDKARAQLSMERKQKLTEDVERAKVKLLTLAAKNFLQRRRVARATSEDR